MRRPIWPIIGGWLEVAFTRDNLIFRRSSICSRSISAPSHRWCGSVDRWGLWEIATDLFDRRADRAARAIAVPIDELWRSGDLALHEGRLYLNYPKHERLPDNMRVCHDLPWGPAHLAIIYERGRCSNRLTTRPPPGRRFRGAKYFDRSPLTLYDFDGQCNDVRSAQPGDRARSVRRTPIPVVAPRRIR